MQSDSQEKRYLSTRECAAAFGLSKGLLDMDRCTRKYGVPFIKVGKKVLYDRKDIEAFLAARKVTAGAAE